MPDPSIIVAIIAGLASIFVAVIQALSARKAEAQAKAQAKGHGAVTLPQPSKKLLLLLLVLNLTAVAAAVSWIIIGATDPGHEVREYQNLVSEAKAKKPYIVDSTAVHVRLDDLVPKTGVGKRQASVRITYVLRAFRDISDSEGAFIENYRLNPKKLPEHWFGTNVID